MEKGVKQIAMNLSGGGMSDNRMRSPQKRSSQHTTLGETASIISFISCDMRQIGLSLVSNLAPTVTARCGAGYLTNYLGGYHYPILDILVIYDNPKQTR